MRKGSMADKFDFDLEVNPIETGPKNQIKETGVSADSVHFSAQTPELVKAQSIDTEISKAKNQAPETKKPETENLETENPETENSSILSDDLINNMADSISEESLENPVLADEVAEDVTASENIAASKNVEDSESIEASEKTNTTENTEISEDKDHILDEVLKENNYEEPVEDSAPVTISGSVSEGVSEFASSSASDPASETTSESTTESNSNSASENTEANADVETPAKKEKTKAQKIFLRLLAALIAAGIALFIYFFFFANVSASTFSKIFYKVSGSDIEFQQFVTGDTIQQADLRVSLSRGSTENSAAVHATLNFTMKGDNSPILLGLEGILAEDGKIYLKLDHLKDSLTAVLKGSGKEIDSEMQKSLDDFAMEIENKWQRIDADEVIAGVSSTLGFTLPKVLQSSIAGTLSCVTQNIGKTHNQQSDLMAKLYRDNEFANFTELSSEESASYAKLSGDLGKLYRVTFNDNKLSRFLEAANKASQNTELSKCLSNAYSLAPNSYEEEEQGVLKDKTIKDYDKYIQEIKSTVNIFVGINTFTGDIRGLIFTTPSQKNSKELDQTHAVMRFKDSKKKEIKTPAESTPIFDSLSKILKLDQFEEILKKTPLQNPLQGTTDAEKLLKDANLI